MRIVAIIPAAGIGSRMGGDTPKQYLDLAGKPILTHTLTRIAAVDAIDEVVVAIHAADNIFATLDVPTGQIKISTVLGGESRKDSVYNALNNIDNLSKDDWVLVHDAARPLVAVSDIEKLITAVADHPVGGILACPVVDTLKQADASQQISKTLDRNQIWRALTPQLFRFGVLSEALQTNNMVTDEAEAVEALGYQPLLVEGSAENIKITTPEDLAFAEWLLANGES